MSWKNIFKKVSEINDKAELDEEEDEEKCDKLGIDKYGSNTEWFDNINMGFKLVEENGKNILYVLKGDFATPETLFRYEWPFGENDYFLFLKDIEDLHGYYFPDLIMLVVNLLIKEK